MESFRQIMRNILTTLIYDEKLEYDFKLKQNVEGNQMMDNFRDATPVVCLLSTIAFQI
jgi:hypothetical protein